MILTHFLTLFWGGGGGVVVVPPPPVEEIIGGPGPRRKRTRPEKRGRHILPDGSVMFGTFTEYAERILELFPAPVLSPAVVRTEAVASAPYVGENWLEPKALVKATASLRQAVKAPNLDAYEQGVRWDALRRLIELQDEEDAIAILLLN